METPISWSKMRTIPALVLPGNARCKLLTGLFFALLFLLLPFQARAQNCAPGLTACGAACVNFSTDPNNCGNCGHACRGGQTCTAGVCSGNSNASCAPGMVMCGSGCVNYSTDPKNCGNCGQACQTGQTCTQGVCSAGNVNGKNNGTSDANGKAACAPGKVMCGAQCVNLSINLRNCGACGQACQAGQTCTAGVCSGAANVSGKSSGNGK